MKGLGPILIIAGGAGVIYYLYAKGYFTSSSTTTTPVSSTPPTTTTTTGTTTTSAPTGSGSLASIYAGMVANAQAPTSGLTPYQWNFSLQNMLTPLGKTAPDPQAVFPAGTDLTQNMSASQYWTVMAPYLTATMGISGLRGLGRIQLVPAGWA